MCIKQGFVIRTHDSNDFEMLMVLKLLFVEQQKIKSRENSQRSAQDSAQNKPQVIIIPEL